MTQKRILVVDDEEMIVDVCRRVLTSEGYHVLGASSAEEALKMSFSEPIHLAVMDMLMPGMDGLEAYPALKQNHPDILGILISGHGTMDTAIQAMENGFSGFIRKPFTPMELLHVVKDSFDRVKLREENTRLKTLIPLYQLGQKFSASHTREEILDDLMGTVSSQTAAQEISVMLWDEAAHCLRTAGGNGFQEESVRKVRRKEGERIADRVYQSGKPFIISGGAQSNPKLSSFLESKNIVASITVPLKARDKVLGVLTVNRLNEGPLFTQSDIEMLSVICSQAGMALEHVRIMDERAEKVRMRTLLEQYVAPEVAEVLISHGQNPMEVGEIRSITVLFADIRKFTPLVQHLPLNMLRSFLNSFFDLLTDVIFKFQGTLDKFMGDAVLAIFGAPNQLNEPGNAAVSAAIETLRRFDKIREVWTSKERHFGYVGLGIGISSGEMFLGNVGSQKRLDYTVIGTDVNIAQRLASEAASGQILITESVSVQLDSRFRVAQETSRLLRGIENPVTVLSVMNQ
jgi:adenylate cyclase